MEARLDERAVALGGGRQLKLFAFLLLHANRAVSADALIDGVWGPERDGGVRRLHMAISRLRKALEPLGTDDGSVLRTVSGGYLLAIGSGELDAELFQELVLGGRSALAEGDPARASMLTGEALALWRGAPLAEVSFEDFAQAEIARLEELRLTAIEQRLEAELALGREPQVVGDLERLVREHPYRERLRGQLMLALYRTGRQADALAAYQAARRTLIDELGIEPSLELRELEQRMLRHDPLLTPPGAEAPSLAVDRLPVPATPFLGRIRELAEVTALLQGIDTRLLTLTGAGGSGKTRLALRAARARAEEYPGGAWFVGFADVGDPGLIAPTICQALGVVEQPELTPAQRVEAHLRDHELLLVLDNLEQLIPGVEVLGEILAACPGLRMLVTSREPLHLAGEQQYEVPVLDPDDAIDLFTACARAVAPKLVIEPETAGAVCERLDRLPLAIELAAARSKTLSPEEILARLERRLPVLGHGPRNAPRRQRTLQRTIDWSYQLLTDDEQRLLRRLSVFADGCILQAAEAVCDADLDTLHALVDRSLVRAGAGRYSMLQTIREYALEKLAESGEEEHVRHRHAQWFVELLQAPGVGTFAEPETIEKLAAERQNFRAALEWADRAGDIETVARLFVQLSWEWNVEGNLAEAGRWLDVVRRRPADYPPALKGQVLTAARNLAWTRGSYSEAVELCEQALTAYRELGDVTAIVLETSSLAACQVHLGNLPRGRALLTEALALAHEHDLTRWLPTVLGNLADIAIAEGALDEAQALCEEALTLVPEADAGAGVAIRINLAHIANLKGRHAVAAELAQQALDGGVAIGDLNDAAAAAVMLAWSLAELQQPERAGPLLGAALEFFRHTGTGMQWSGTFGEQAVRDSLRAQLDARTSYALIDQGRPMTLEQFARSEPQSLPPR